MIQEDKSKPSVVPYFLRKSGVATAEEEKSKPSVVPYFLRKSGVATAEEEKSKLSVVPYFLRKPQQSNEKETVETKLKPTPKQSQVKNPQLNKNECNLGTRWIQTVRFRNIVQTNACLIGWASKMIFINMLDFEKQVKMKASKILC